MKPFQANLTLAVSTLVLSVASFFVVMQGATDEPYTTFRQYDALVQVGVAMVLMLLWLQVGIAIVVAVVRSRISLWWFPMLLWVAICEFYLFHSPVGYVSDISRFVAQQ